MGTALGNGLYCSSCTILSAASAHSVPATTRGFPDVINCPPFSSTDVTTRPPPSTINDPYSELFLDRLEARTTASIFLLTGAGTANADSNSCLVSPTQSWCASAGFTAAGRASLPTCWHHCNSSSGPGAKATPLAAAETRSRNFLRATGETTLLIGSGRLGLEWPMISFHWVTLSITHEEFQLHRITARQSRLRKI